MAAAGLNATCKEDVEKNLMAVAEYALTIQKQLQYVNEHSWNNFKLRIGKLSHQTALFQPVFCELKPEKFFFFWRSEG